MVPIKFRYRDAETGRLMYHEFTGNELAQLVGYDADGREVYDGDEVRSQRDGKIYKAEFQRVIVRQKPYHEIIDYDIDRSTLIKEAK